MTRLDTIISNVIDSYRQCFWIASVFALIGTALARNWIGFGALCVILPLSYFGGLYLIAWTLPRFISRDLLVEEFRTKRIQILNEKLESGELVADSPELAAEMAACGLEPLSVIVEKGPVFARQFDADMHEWVDAKKGEGPIIRYVYKEVAQFDVNDGTVFVPDRKAENDYLVLEGQLYEHVPEPVAEV